MRILTIGDIHGCLRAFDALLELVRPQPSDLVVTLGDYIDRGPHSALVLDRLIALRDQCRHVALIGNHDLMMMQAHGSAEAFDDWVGCGGRYTLESYDAEQRWDGFARSVPERHWTFLADRCVSYYEVDTHFFVHANVYPDYPLDEQPDYMLLWEKLDAETSRPHESGKVMICGHTSQRNGVPLNLGHAVCIDTRVFADGWLTCLDVRTSKYWQANQHGETRSGWLDSQAQR